ncbi:MAG: prepilin peptidase [Planctomycetia bacterium]|nr:prepilin peptidase [Planctomycetia bacterium]
MDFLFIVLAFWFFFIGSAFGSFLNVVVWRLPLGISLNYPASHCPKCRKPIRWRHNIPVIGWGMLRGKCYDCGLPISRRYPLVEFLCGCVFLSLFYGYFWPFIRDGLNSTVGLSLLELMCISVTYMLQVTFFLTFLAAGLILLDGNRVPKKLFLPLAILLLLRLCMAGYGI